MPLPPCRRRRNAQAPLTATRSSSPPPPLWSVSSLQVADYGLARTSEVMLGAHDRAKSKSKSRSRPPPPKVGALRWMAPELLQASTDGVDVFTEASDVYRCGVDLTTKKPCLLILLTPTPRSP